LHLAQNAIFCIGIANRGGICMASPSCSSESVIYNWITASRQRITDLHTSALGTTYGTLLESIVLGNRCVELPSDLIEKYRKVGLSHLLAASGFNLTIIILVLNFVVKTLTRSKPICALATLSSIVMFALLAGLSPSVVRAAACCLVVLMAVQSGRSLNATAILAMVLITVLIIDPAASIDVGAQLSYAATFGILKGARPLAAFLLLPLPNLKPDSADINPLPNTAHLSKATRACIIFAGYVFEAIAVVLSAQAAVLPIQLAYFWRLGTMFLPASVLVDPLVAPITVLGFASSTLILIQPAFGACARLLDLLALVPLKTLNAVADYFAQIEGTYLNFGPPAPVSVIVYYLALALFCASLIAGHRRVLTLFFVIVSLIALIWRSNLPEPIICVGRNSLVFLGTDRNAIVLGDGNSAGKCLAYWGAKVTSDKSIVFDGVASEPITFCLKGGAQTLKFLFLNNIDADVFFNNRRYARAEKRAGECGVYDSNSCVIVVLYKARTLSKDALAQIQSYYSADYALLVQRHFPRRKKHAYGPDPLPFSSPLESHRQENNELQLSLFCERGMQARLIKRGTSVTEH